MDNELKKILEDRRKWQAAYRKRRNKKGLVRIAVWVPKWRAEGLKLLARAMCLEKKPKQKSDPLQAPIVPTKGKGTAWSYVEIGFDDILHRIILKANKAQWQNKTKIHPNTWRIRSDLVSELGLEDLVVAED